MKRTSERFLRLASLCLALLLAESATSAHANPRVVLPYLRGFPLATVEVPLTLRYGTNDFRDVVGLQADVTFSGGQVAVGPVEPGTAVDNHVLRLAEPVAGTTRFLVFSPNNRVLTKGSVVLLPNIRKDALCKSHFLLLFRRAMWEVHRAVEKVRNSWNSSFPQLRNSREPVWPCCAMA